MVLPNPTELSERQSVARTCVVDLGIEFPALVDDMENSTDDAYTAWPERLYLIDRQGQVTYKGKPGPFGFDPEELGRELDRLVGSPSEG